LLNNYPGSARGLLSPLVTLGLCDSRERGFGAGDIFDANTTMGTKLSGRKDNGTGSRERLAVINSPLSCFDYRRHQQAGKIPRIWKSTKKVTNYTLDSH
jgi:hypothetical protein